ncbi:MAG: PAS domain-containing protein, partial [Myxococcota bacterium]
MSEREDTVFSLPLGSLQDVAYARQRAREIAELLGVDNDGQTRLATAVSEIVCNAVMYGDDARVDYAVRDGDPIELVVVVRDCGPGIRDLPGLLAGRHRAGSDPGIGITGARHLLDRFTIESSPSGTEVVMGLRLPDSVKYPDRAVLDRITGDLARRSPGEPCAELQRQNRELLRALEDVRRVQAEAARANDELDVLLGLVPVIIWRADEDGQGDYFNPRWYEYTGQRRTESAGEGWSRAVHPDDRERVKAAWLEAVARGEPYRIEHRLRRADGEYRWHLTRAAKLRDRRQGARWFGSITDIHDARQREVETARVADFRERMLGVVGH